MTTDERAANWEDAPRGIVTTLELRYRKALRRIASMTARRGVDMEWCGWCDNNRDEHAPDYCPAAIARAALAKPKDPTP